MTNEDAARSRFEFHQLPTVAKIAIGLAMFNTWVIFGFAEGADAGDAGERGFFSDAVFRLARGVGTFAEVT